MWTVCAFLCWLLLLQLTSWSVLPLCSGMSGFLYQSVPDNWGTEIVLSDSMIDVACTFDLAGEWGEQVTTAGWTVFRNFLFLAPESCCICTDNQPCKFFSNARHCWLSFLPELDKVSLLIDLMFVYLLMVTLKDDGQVNMGNFLVSTYTVEGIEPGHWAVRVVIVRDCWCQRWSMNYRNSFLNSVW